MNVAQPLLAAEPALVPALVLLALTPRVETSLDAAGTTRDAT